MMNFPQALFDMQSVAGPSRPLENPTAQSYDPKYVKVVKDLITNLQFHDTREHSLKVLSQNKRIREDLGPWLWESFGTIFILIQELTSAYYLLSSPSELESKANRVCNALALFQCVASHPDTKMKFLQANIPFYLYPLLNTTNKEKPYEYIRVTALGVIGALVKTDDADVITSLLETQVFPHFLRCMEMENILSKTVSTFIVNKILQNDEGLKYCCAMAERFFAVGNVLLKLVENLAVARAPDKRLLKHVICCYQRLSENPRACDGLTACFPAKLRENTLVDVIRDDPTIMSHLQKFIYNVANRHQSRAVPADVYGRPTIS